MSSLLQVLRQKRLLQWTVAYAAGAWLVVEILDYLASLYAWSPALMPKVTVAAGFGFVVTLILAWFHGESGVQRMVPVERVLLGVVCAGAVLAIWSANAQLPNDTPEEELPLRVTPSTIAVLPFDNLSTDPSDAVFTEGFQIEVHTRLSQVSRLRMISRTSVQQYRDRPENLRTVAEQLGAGSVLEGSVRWMGDMVRVNIQLVDALTDQRLWTEEYDRHITPSNLFEIQSDVAQHVATALSIEIREDERRRLDARPTESLEAYRLYLRGARLVQTLRRADLEEANRLFHEALRVDPLFALAHAGLGASYFWLGHGYGDVRTRDVAEPARAACLRALELDPSLAEAHAVLGHLLFEFDQDWEGAKRSLETAIRLNPSSAEARQAYFFYLLVLRRFDDAEREFEVLLQLDPLSPTVQVDRAQVPRMRGDYAVALELSQAAVSMHPGLPLAHARLARTYNHMGRYAEAARQLEQIQSPTHRDLGVLGFSYARAGETEKARAILDRLTAESHDGYVWPLAFTWVYAGFQETDATLDWMERAFEERVTLVQWLRLFPEFDFVKDHPRFQAIMQAFNFPDG